jgi:arylsulfatase A-like enzyme
MKIRGEAGRAAAVLLAVASVAGVATGSPEDARAGCVLATEADLVQKSLGQANGCDYKLLRTGNPSCQVTPPPACAGTLTVDANNLSFGTGPLAKVDTRALGAQLNCQKRIGEALLAYIDTKLRLTIEGETPTEAEAKAVKQLDRLALYCTINAAQDVTSGIVLPVVGPQCAAAIPAPGDAVDIAALRECLRQLGETWVVRFGPKPQPLRPNILFILSDDQRWDTTDDTHSPVPGQPIMPGLHSELGGSGIEFVNAFISTPLCCPSRASIYRGQYAHNTGVHSNAGANGGADDFVPLEGETVATLLQAAGYRTGFLGKYLNGYGALWSGDVPHVPPGWDDWGSFKEPGYFDYELIDNGVIVPYGSEEADYSTDVLRERAKRFISETVALGQPFFLHLAFKAPHGPFFPAPRHEGMFSGLAPWRPASFNEPDVSDKPTWVKNTQPLPPAQQDDIDYTRIRQLEVLQAVDEAIGGSTTHGITGIMQHLRDLGIADNTLVVYVSDNGWGWGEHRLEGKNKPYEESIRAPMFVRFPKLAPLPRVESKFALNIDLCPTFVDLALRTTDPQPTVSFDGVSLLGLLDGTASSWRTDFLTEGWPTGHVWATVREARWKYTELPLQPGNPNTLFERELYDLETDPLELVNVADDAANAQRVADMAARLRQLRPSWPVDAHAAAEDPNE